MYVRTPRGTRLACEKKRVLLPLFCVAVRTYVVPCWRKMGKLMSKVTKVSRRDVLRQETRSSLSSQETGDEPKPCLVSWSYL